MANLNEQAIRVENYREVLRAFGRAEKTLERGFKKSLREAADPIREDVERRAGSGVIENLHSGDRWTDMRIGVTRSFVYVAPRERGRRTRSRPAVARPNLKPLLLERAFAPALRENRDQVIENVEGVLFAMGRAWDE